MTKSELIKKVAGQSGQTQSATAKFLDAFTETVKESLKAGEFVSISQFGTFKKVDREERLGVNPKNGERITIAAKSAPKFKPSANFLN